MAILRLYQSSLEMKKKAMTVYKDIGKYLNFKKYSNFKANLINGIFFTLR